MDLLSAGFSPRQIAARRGLSFSTIIEQIGRIVEILGAHDRRHAVDLWTAHYRRTVVGRLTPRERQALDLVGHGLSRAQIAAQLGLMPATVETHLRHACYLLHARDQDEAAAIWRELCRADSEGEVA